jgi:DNA-binding transcriptional MerR regulator
VGQAESAHDEGAYGLGAVVRLTGLSAHVIRAWERRYGVVHPRRTPGGTRRYAESDVARLRLLAAAVAEGHRIGELAPLADDAIERMLGAHRERPAGQPPLAELVAAADRLDLAELERLLGLQLAAVGPAAYARHVVAPLLREIGERWEHGQSSVAAEHLTTTLTRTLLGSVLRFAPHAAGAPRLVFSTPQGERHEIGALIAAVVAVNAGADATFLGPDLPVADLVEAAQKLRPAALVLGAVGLPAGLLRRYLVELRECLADSVPIWLGGAAALEDVAGVHRVADLDELERRVSSLLRRPASIAR